MEQTAVGAPTLVALRLSEEKACEGYLNARKVMVKLAGHAASLSQLVAERPNRLDYRTARNNALAALDAATQRTRLAYVGWQRAQRRYDAAWTATEGRNLVPGVAEVRSPQRIDRADRAA